jgi:uncharacterized protein YukJ
MSHLRTKPAGQARTYGILVGRVRDGQMDPDGTGSSQHYEIWIEADTDYRVAVNVRSVDDSNVFAFLDPKFTNATKLDLPTRAVGAPGFTELKTGPGGEGLDYLRDNLFPIASMTQIPPQGSGVTLENLLDGQIERAKADSAAVALICGEFFQDGGADSTFGFSPERGVHDIHMMQGNSGRFADDNRVNGDGALFLRFAGGETVALFIRFNTQATSTSDSTGNPE